jgi:hypothetical protein
VIRSDTPFAPFNVHVPLLSPADIRHGHLSRVSLLCEVARVKPVMKVLGVRGLASVLVADTHLTLLAVVQELLLV